MPFPCILTPSQMPGGCPVLFFALPLPLHRSARRCRYYLEACATNKNRGLPYVYRRFKIKGTTRTFQEHEPICKFIITPILLFLNSFGEKTKQ